MEDLGIKWQGDGLDDVDGTIGTLSASFGSNDLKKLALPGILFHTPLDSGGIQYERAD